jgi:hypothetical protein
LGLRQEGFDGWKWTIEVKYIEKLRWWRCSPHTQLPAMLKMKTVAPSSKAISLVSAGLILSLAFSACRKQEQEVAGAAANAAHSAQQAAAHAAQSAQNHAQLARAAATESATASTALEHIPLPTKSLYVNVHEPAEWKNPFLTVAADQVDLRVIMTDANPSPVGAGTMLRPESARQQELQIRLVDLPKALIALPDGAWRYGRVVAIAESPDAPRKSRPAIRRNMEAAIQKLNDMGVVVEEWPGR